MDIQDKLRDLLTEEWQTTLAIANRAGEPFLEVVPVLRKMWAAGEVESSHGRWRRTVALKPSADS